MENVPPFILGDTTYVYNRVFSIPTPAHALLADANRLSLVLPTSCRVPAGVYFNVVTRFTSPLVTRIVCLSNGPNVIVPTAESAYVSPNRGASFSLESNDTATTRACVPDVTNANVSFTTTTSLTPAIRLLFFIACTISAFFPSALTAYSSNESVPPHVTANRTRERARVAAFALSYANNPSHGPYSDTFANVVTVTDDGESVIALSVSAPTAYAVDTRLETSISVVSRTDCGAGLGV
jgi:hypothetical protein